jgi:glycosyltransferase involved in cell wall biosynthesis
MPIEPLLLLPTYNNVTTLSLVLEEAKRHVAAVLVVNDGSTDGTKQLLSGLFTGNVIHHEKNLGKGEALRTGLEFALKNGFKTVISMDTDGQHLVEDLPRVIKAAAENPEAIIIGDRQLSLKSEDVPGHSRFGRRFSDFWVWLETGKRIADTQSGFRAYPVCRLLLSEIATRKFDFEIEILVRSMWHGVPVKSIPVGVFYPEKQSRISHFEPFWDNFRLTLLHSRLMVERALRVLGLRNI